MSSTADVEDRLLQVSEQLQIPHNTLQITQVRLGQLRNKPDVDEGNIDDYVAAALALSAREDGLPIREDVIEDTWSETLGPDRTISLSNERLETTRQYLDVESVPPHPIALLEQLGQSIEMPESLIVVARRLLNDAYERDPTVVAGGRSPTATAGGSLALSALVNGHDADDVQNVLGGASDTSRIAIKNRCEELQKLLGEERLGSDRYRMATDVDTAAAAESDQATAADGAGRAEADAEAEPAVEEAVESQVGDETGETVEATEQTGDEAEQPDGRADQAATDVRAQDVKDEIDALVDELDIDASSRLMARGMVGDAVGEVDVGSAVELAGGTLVASLRMNDADTDVVDVASARALEPRAVTQSLDALDGAVDVDIPRRSPAEIVAEIVAELGLPEAVHDETRRALERYDGVDDFTAAELSAGAVVFAATVNGIQADIEQLGAISGADPSYVTDAMNAVVVSLCLGLVRGEIDYEECSWTNDLLESELSSNLGDSQTGRAIAVAKTYVAGREGGHIDDATLEAVLGGE